MNPARRHLLRWLAVVIVGVLALAGCSSGSSGSATSAPKDRAAAAGATGSPDEPEVEQTPEAPPVAVKAVPAFGTAGVAPSEPVSVSVDGGTIDSLTMTGSDGTTVAGEISSDRTSWSLTDPLGFGETYTVAGTATSSDGRSAPISGTYTTVSPEAQVRNTVFPLDDAVVGVAAPVTVKFGVEPVDKAAVAKRVTLTSVPKVEGAWAWIQQDDGQWGLNYRPKEYWPAGTKVHVSAELYGVELAPGAFGRADVTTDFTIGRNQVVVADVNSHDMVVKRDGQVVASYPASYGRGGDSGDPNLVTRSGIHVVTDMHEEYLMNNPRYGYSNSFQRWAVRISNNGEFIHANPASSGAQGNTNVTHGCINLSLANGEEYFKSAIWGDPVEITGTDVKLGPRDGDIWIWGLSWAEWLALGAA